MNLQNIIYLHPLSCWNKKELLEYIKRDDFEKFIYPLIYKNLNNNLNIFNFEGFISYTPSDSIVEGINELHLKCLREDKQLVLTHLPDEFFSILADTYTTNNSHTLISLGKQNEDLEEITIPRIEIFIEETKSELTQFLKDKGQRRGHFKLYSSNLHSNCYLDLGSLLKNPLLLFNIGYCFYHYLTTNGENPDVIICPSRVGTILGVSLGFFCKNSKVVYLDRIGPKGILQNISVPLVLKEAKSPIFISDMVVSGTEIKVAKSILYTSNNVKINQLLTVLTLFPMNNIYSLVDNIVETFDYKIWTSCLCELCDKKIELIDY